MFRLSMETADDTGTNWCCSNSATLDLLVSRYQSCLWVDGSRMATRACLHSSFTKADHHLRYGGTEKGNIVKDCLETAWNHGINFFVSTPKNMCIEASK